LNVTRGSFYHHFKNRADFVRRLLERWEEEYTTAVLADACLVPDPMGRLQRYIGIAAKLHPGREVAIRAWAKKDALVRSILQRVEALRMAFARESARALLPSSIQRDEVEAFARLAYLGFIGMQHLARDDDAQFHRFFADLTAMGRRAASA
jgi:AcrR family transcriptional regulator